MGTQISPSDRERLGTRQPLLGISPLLTKNVQRKPSPLSCPKVQGKDKRESFGKDSNTMGHIQIVPETSYLTLNLEEELLYE